MTWQPLSQRTVGLQPDGPFEGVPPHLRAALVDWLGTAFSNGPGFDLDVLRAVGVSLRLDVDPGWSRRTVVNQYLSKTTDPEFFLDLVDCLLAIRYGDPYWNGVETLRAHLERGASVWRVNDAWDGLERRVSAELSETVKRATTPDDEASKQLREAWANAYGRNGDPSHAWGHAVTALEALLLREVVPGQSKPNLGHVVGELKKKPADGNKWKSKFPGREKDHSTLPLAGALELVWPNPNRHGDPNPRVPTEEEARAVVAVTAALVQAHRESPLVYKDEA